MSWASQNCHGFCYVVFKRLCVSSSLDFFLAELSRSFDFLQGHNEGLKGSRRADLFVYVLQREYLELEVKSQNASGSPAPNV